MIFVVSLVNKWNNRSAHFCMAMPAIQCALRLFHLFTNETTNINYQFLIEILHALGLEGAGFDPRYVYTNYVLLCDSMAVINDNF